MNSDPREIVDRTWRQAAVVIYAFALGVVLFAAAATWLVTTGRFVPALGPLDPVILAGLALLGLVLAIGGGTIGDRITEVPAGGDPEVAATRWLTGVVVAGSLRESAGLLGGGIVLLTGAVVPGLAVAGVATLLLLLNRPDRERLRQAVRRG